MALPLSSLGDCSPAAYNLDLQPCGPQPYNLQFYLHPCTLQPCTRVGGIGKMPQNSNVSFDANAMNKSKVD
jgi:hypothetical protein